jgi:hypothetical protein
MFGPLASISPSEAILISTPGRAFPTVPNLKSSIRFAAITGEDSVKP